MEIKVAKIGVIDQGIDGRDEYVLLTRSDDELTPEQAENWLLDRVYRHTDRPGGYFCNTVLATQAPSSTNAVICIVQHRYDV